MKLSKLSDKLNSSSRDALLARVAELEKSGAKLIHFEIGEPDFSTPAAVTEAAIGSLRRDETHYDTAAGLPELRSAIASRIKEGLGFLPDIDQIVVGPSPMLIYFLMQCVADPGDEVVVQDPAYARFFSILNILGLTPVTLPIYEKNGFHMTEEDIRAKIGPKTRLIITNSPQNPTGVMFTEKESEMIAGIAKEKNVFVLSDEVYDRLVYGEKHYSPSTADYCKERTVILNSLSKTYAMTGWRVGYLVGPSELISKIGILIRNTLFSLPVFIQRAAVEALTGDQQPIKLMVEEYRKRRDAFVAGLNQLPGVSCANPGGALYVFPNISKTGMTSRQFVEFMIEKAGVIWSPGTDFGDAGEGFVRGAFCIPLADIEEGIKRMKAALSEKK